MKSYTMLYIDKITCKYRIYKYLWSLLCCYMRVLLFLAKYSSNKRFRDVFFGELFVTDANPIKTKANLL